VIHTSTSRILALENKASSEEMHKEGQQYSWVVLCSTPDTGSMISWQLLDAWLVQTNQSVVWANQRCHAA
jgi:hypothetical protein